MPLPSLKDIVKDNTARFSFYRNGQIFYTVDVPDHGELLSSVTRYQFPVSLVDIAGASLFAEEKAIMLMRYIRKALEEKTFVPA